MLYLNVKGWQQWRLDWHRLSFENERPRSAKTNTIMLLTTGTASCSSKQSSTHCAELAFLHTSGRSPGPAGDAAAWRAIRHAAPDGRWLRGACLARNRQILLVGHVFVLNDWAGISGDLCDPNRVAGVFTTKAIPRRGMICLSLVLLALSLSVLAKFGYSTLLITVAIAGLSGLYSFPGIHAKGVPVMNSASDFVGGLAHFLLGYSVFSAPDWRGIQIGSFFALVFVAGHLTHETRDSDSDLLNGIRTNAVTFGKSRNFMSGLILFAIADAILVSLALLQSVRAVQLPRLSWHGRCTSIGLCRSRARVSRSRTFVDSRHVIAYSMLRKDC